MSGTPHRHGRVLVIAYDFPPHGAIGTMRTLRVVRELHARGWDVTVLTSDPASYLPGTPVDAGLLDRVPHGVRVVRAGALRGWSALDRLLRRAAGAGGGTVRERPALRTHPDSGAPRTRRGLLARVARVKDTIDAALSIPDRESGWLLPATARGVLDAVRHGTPDLIYSSAPPWTGQLVAFGLQRLLGCAWVADFRDPWSRAPWREDRRPFAVRAAAALERAVVRRADRILFVTNGNREDFAAQYGSGTASRLHVVPNGCDASEFDGLYPAVQPSVDPFVLLHAGSLYAGRSPLPLFEGVAAAIAQGTIDPARFRIRFMGSVGRGVEVPGHLEVLARHNVVEFAPRVPRAESLRAMTTASALLLLQPGHALSVPGKLYEYLAAGRPILAITEEGEIPQVIQASGMGVAVPPDDAGAIVAGLAAVMRMAAGGMARPPRELYDGRARAAEAADVLEEVLRGGPDLPARRRIVPVPAAGDADTALPQ